jgi:DNA-binding transcriptional ArsR family regulator
MPPAKTAATMETTLAAIVAHPTRARCFVILAERTASPVEIAQEIGKDVGHVGYHVRKLQQLNLIELVNERPVRGAVEHFYRAIERPVITEDEFVEQSIDEREAFTRYTLQLLVTDIARAMDEHTFDKRQNRVLVRMPMVVDADGFQELSDMHTEVFERTMDIQARSAERLTKSDEDSIPTISTSMFFETPQRRRKSDAIDAA